MPPRLKVFVTSDGLTDFVVAASSRVKALAAWGVHQDVFKTGLAHETDDPELTKAATAKPGEVLRRPAQSRAELASLKPAARSKLQPQPKPAPEPKPRGPSKAALKKVADLEARLAALDADHERQAAALARERAALDRRAEALQADHAARRDKLQAALSAARRALG
jgi:hypothetical protein